MQTRELFLDGYELYEANQGSFRIRGIGAIDRWFSRTPIPRAENRGVSACAQRASQLRSLEERLPLLGGLTIHLSRAAERGTMKRHGHINEYMFVNRRWRRRLPRHVGPGHG